jgi:hypothetical protein
MNLFTWHHFLKGYVSCLLLHNGLLQAASEGQEPRSCLVVILAPDFSECHVAALKAWPCLVIHFQSSSPQASQIGAGCWQHASVLCQIDLSVGLLGSSQLDHWFPLEQEIQEEAKQKPGCVFFHGVELRASHLSLSTSPRMFSIVRGQSHSHRSIGNTGYPYCMRKGSNQGENRKSRITGDILPLEPCLVGILRRGSTLFGNGCILLGLANS